MRKIYYLYCLLLFPSLIMSQDALFMNTYGGNMYDSGFGIDTITNTNVIVFGNTSSYGSGNNDLLVFSLNKAGTVRWQRYFGSSGVDQGSSFCRTYDNGFVICGYTNRNATSSYDIWVIKIDSLGNKQWEKTYGTSDWDFAYGICELNNHELALCGQTYCNSTQGDAFALKLSASGDSIWWKQLGNGLANAITPGENNIYLAGKTKTTLHPNNYNASIVKLEQSSGNLVWEKTQTDTTENCYNSILYYSKDTLVACGYMYDSNTHFFQGTLALFDITGTNLNKNRDITQYNTKFNKVKYNYKKQILVLGSADNPGAGGKNDFRLFVTDKYLHYIDAPTYGGSEDDLGIDFIEFRNHQVQMCGTTNSFGNSLSAILVIKTDSNYRSNQPSKNYSLYAENLLAPSDFSIFPNPTTSFIQIKKGKSESCIVKIIDGLGGLCLTDTMDSFEHEKTISVNNLKSGLYIVELISGNSHEHHKLIIR